MVSSEENTFVLTNSLEITSGLQMNTKPVKFIKIRIPSRISKGSCRQIDAKIAMETVELFKMTVKSNGEMYRKLTMATFAVMAWKIACKIRYFSSPLSVREIQSVLGLNKCTEIKSPFYTTIHGLEHCPVAAGYADLNLFRSGLEYAPRDSDIFIVSYPKSGTTWMQMIVWLLLNDLEPPKYIDQLTDDNFLEYFAGKEGVSKMKEPRQIKSHLPFDLIPFNPKAKYIHVCRNPFDVCVSLYKHTYGFKKYYFDGSMDEFFEYFHKGEVEFGDYYSHLSSWYEQSHPNILFVTFEEMKENIKGVVENIVKFIGGEIEARASQDGFIDKLVKMSKFSEMQKLPQKEIMKEGQAFVSQGKAGNFSNALNEDQLSFPQSDGFGKEVRSGHGKAKPDDIHYLYLPSGELEKEMTIDWKHSAGGPPFGFQTWGVEVKADQIEGRLLRSLTG
ncbi:Sulfotransferase family cytosolic 2B member 1 [Nymphon striatum]|nr:Sulfotransferase family cytosolic 2B member 1 [Nymphon striatum]